MDNWNENENERIGTPQENIQSQPDNAYGMQEHNGDFAQGEHINTIEDISQQAQSQPQNNANDFSNVPDYGSYSSYYNRVNANPNQQPPQYMQQPYNPQVNNTPYQQQYSAYYGNAGAPVPPQPPKKKPIGKIIFAALLALTLAAGGLGIAYSMNKLPVRGNNTSTTTAADETDKTTSVTGGDSIQLSPTPGGDVGSSADGTLTPRQIAEKLSPSNVGIVVYSADGKSIQGQGSGIVMTEDGYILTCAHVIDEVKNGLIRVVMDDNTEYEATIVGYDARTDIGVVKVTPTKALKVAEFGDSDALKVGDNVLAIGNPGGLQFFGSLSNGLVSAIDRPVNSSIGYTMKSLQHTAAISPGNSGGMLVNMYGQVIGINSAKIASTEYEGIGFAIPISSAKPIIDDLVQYGYVKDRAKLGITYSKINQNYQYYMAAYSFGLPTGSIVIEKISDDSDIKNYDVQVYDFITAVNGKALSDGSELTEIIEKSKPGDKLTLTISRISDGTIKSFNITCKLVEDKGTASVPTTEPTTQPQNQNPFDNGSGFGRNPFEDYGSDPFGFGY